VYEVTVTTARCKTLRALRETFKEKRCYIHDRAEDMLLRAVAQAPANGRTFRVAILTVSELGFERRTAYLPIGTRALGRGLLLCPGIVGPCLRLRLCGQQGKENLSNRITVAMEPMPNFLGNPFVFELVRAFGHDLLYADWVCDHTEFNPHDSLAFLKT